MYTKIVTQILKKYTDNYKVTSKNYNKKIN